MVLISYCVVFCGSAFMGIWYISKIWVLGCQTPLHGWGVKP